ncbi:erythromycin esterase family protein [Nocardia blacklockiae]|uniref:erythromycin esterase family protein n=1 Tax=Nocardia blacklockiae TaxID=480036 RepID=UPI0018957F29|nr:erythromycin esterase family protein [Nocardia blacklockiae]MBF6172203.1 erythromycin esterase family protein [Nocardia blacklockiae]
MTTTITDAAVGDWLRAAARPVADTDAGYTGADLDALAAELATATVVGLGESTRFSAQTYGVRDRLFRILVREYGFRGLAIQDSVPSGERIDAYVRTGTGDVRAALAQAWRPLRTAETVATLEWIRAFNRDHPDDPVRVFGVEPVAAELADYDTVLDHVRRTAPAAFDELNAHLSVIRTAHQVDEHVQRHQGIHPGRPFAEHARAALSLLESLPHPTAEPTAREDALERARRIVDFHEHSVAGLGGFGRDEHRAARTIIDRHAASGARIVYWDGIAHTAGLPIDMGGAEAERFVGGGSHLRAHFGPRYLSVAIGFHHGDLGVATAPDPAADLLDATLSAVDLPAFYIDLRGEAPPAVERWRQAPAQARVISGVYDPAQDAKARIRVTSLRDAFDVLIHFRETTPVHWLPEFDAASRS